MDVIEIKPIVNPDGTTTEEFEVNQDSNFIQFEIEDGRIEILPNEVGDSRADVVANQIRVVASPIEVQSSEVNTPNVNKVKHKRTRRKRKSANKVMIAF